MRVAVSRIEGHPESPSTWSGTPSQLIRALRAAGHDVIALDPPTPLRFLAYRGFSALTSRVLGRRTIWETEPALLSAAGRRLSGQASAASADVVIACGWHPLGYEDEGTPLVFWGDTTFARRVGATEYWTGISKRTMRLVPEVERQSFARATAVLMASSAATADVVATYGLPHTRAFTVGFGAQHAPPNECISPRVSPVGTVRLLTVGKQWHRKGMDRVLKALELLGARGVDCTLDVVGCLPPADVARCSNVRFHGFLDSSVPKDRLLLEELYRGASIFVLLSRDEPYGVVLTEAAAWGLPVVSTPTLGGRELVVDGVTGLLVLEADVADGTAAAVQRLVSGEDAAYTTMSAATLQHYKERLTWTAKADELVAILRSLIRQA